MFACFCVWVLSTQTLKHRNTQTHNQYMKRLVVVESPTKARTLRRFLPKEHYRIEASMGHVRDLPASAAEIPAKYKDQPWARLGVQTDDTT